MSVVFNDGFYLRNLCIANNNVQSLNMVAYDANKVKLTQSDPVIPFVRTRFVSTKHIGNTDFIYILIFFDTENFNPPPGMNIIQGQSGGGGSVGVTILGFGGSVGASATVTEAYSQPAAAIQLQLKKHVYSNGTVAHWTSWELHSRDGDPSKGEDEYVFSALDAGYLASQGDLLGN